MLAAKRELIRQEISDGTGADIDLEVDRTGVQTGLRIWFSDLGRTRSPIIELRPRGLKRYEAQLSFGSFAGSTIDQMMQADDEEVTLARALVSTVARSATVGFSDGQNLEAWKIDGPGFSLTAEKRGVEDRFGDEALIHTCRELVIPVLGAMAELYGYDPVEEIADSGETPILEGAVTLAMVRRRERNPRNRLLCLRIHGEVCQVCGLDPRHRYGDAGDIIEVHHLQPLSLTGEPRPYDPETDLAPLCPTCHRAAHTRRPLPWTPDELREKMNADGR